MAFVIGHNEHTDNESLATQHLQLRALLSHTTYYSTLLADVNTKMRKIFLQNVGYVINISSFLSISLLYSFFVPIANFFVKEQSNEAYYKRYGETDYIRRKSRKELQGVPGCSSGTYRGASCCEC